MVLEVSIEKYSDKIGLLVGKMLCEDDLSEDTIICFMRLIKALGSIEVQFYKSKSFTEGACLALEKFPKCKELCLECFEAVLSRMNNGESK